MVALVVALSVTGGASLATAQNQGQGNDQSQSPSASSGNGQKQDAPPEAGGPGGDMGPYAIPKKTTEAPPPPPPPTPKSNEGMPDYSIRVNAPLVNVDVMVTTK